MAGPETLTMRAVTMTTTTAGRRTTSRRHTRKPGPLRQAWRQGVNAVIEKRKAMRKQTRDIVVTAFPNPLLERSRYHMAREYSVRAWREGDARTLGQPACGWLLNWGLLLALCHATTARSCELLLVPGGLLPGSAPQRELAVTWGVAALLRVLVWEPLVHGWVVWRFQLGGS